MHAMGLVFPAAPMIFIWFIVAANYVVHMLLRSEWWSTPVVVIGHALVAEQLASFAQCVHTHPGSPPAAWSTTAAMAGDGTIVNGMRVPPRAFYVKRLGTVVLGFDHYCWWIGGPIGWRNRKFFLQFVLSSAALSGFACVLTAIDLITLVPGLLPPGLGGEQQPLHAHRSAQYDVLARNSPYGQPMPMMLIALAFAELRQMDLGYAMALFALVGADAVACLLLGGFGLWHVYMILRNRTSMEPPGEEVYDIGSADNWRQVMGRKWWLWAVPGWLDDAPIGDGMAWPTVEEVSA